ncbi:hypothetical protein ONZ45_g19104 [Pleurotus djamor]|nr:hypothetical protein ONZ45_g19104 [Pleurotus djamor]
MTSHKTRNKKPAATKTKAAKSAPSRKRRSDGDAGEPAQAKRQRISPARSSRPVTIEEEDSGDESQTGETLPPSSRRIMEEIGSEEEDDDGMPRLEDGNDDEDEGEEPEEDAEAERERLRQEWRSPIYAFYEPEPDIETVNGRRCHVFHCTNSKCRRHAIRRYLDTADASSTSNMRKHAKKCWGDSVVAQACQAADVDEARKALGSKNVDGSLKTAFERAGKGKVTYMHRQHTRPEIKAAFVRWISESMRPFEIASDRGFLELMKTGRPQIYIPSPKTISRDVKLVFKKSRERIAKMLQEHDGTISFATDAWTSPNHRAFIAVTAHLEQKGVPLTFLLDIVEVAKGHDGETLAEAFADILNDFGIADKILSVTCDNASANDKMIDKLGAILTKFPGRANHTRCFLHVVNLSAQACIKLFDVPKKKKDGEDGIDEGRQMTKAEKALMELAEGIEDDEAVMLGSRDVEDDDVLPEDVELGDDDDEMTEEEAAELDKDLLPVRTVLLKLRKISYSILRSSTKLLPMWWATLTRLKMKARKMPRDVRTRWNSTYEMVVFAYEYRKAVDSITGERNAGLRKYELNEEEWEIVKQLSEVLLIFKDATLFFSRSTPNLPTVIPAMDFMDEKLATLCLDRKYSISVRAALSLAKRTLNKYYDKTDHSEVYRIAMILHPRHKLAYFQKAKWQSTWIQTAREIFLEEYESSYSSRDEFSEGDDAGEGLDSSKSKDVDHSPKYVNMFDKLPEVAPPPSTQTLNEARTYLESPIEPTVTDALQWWYDRRETYPKLSRMARDYLSIPATSVGVERTFSTGRLILSHVRNRLSAETTRALMCVGSWSKLGYVNDSDVLTVAKLADVADDDEELLDVNWARIGQKSM